MARSARGKKPDRTTQKQPEPAPQKPVVSEPSQAQPQKPQQAIQVEQVKQPGGATIVETLRKYVSLYTLAIVGIMAAMYYIRVDPGYANVFTNWPGNYVNIAQDDGIYHMRLVYNTLAHFPFRIFYDPFTHFPYGSPVHFGPMFTILIAGTALLLGLGSPDPHLVATVGAYMPVILGVLCVIPTYYIAKRLFGREAALIASLALAVVPAGFLGRSMLGSTDHHIAEVLFSTITLVCMIYAIDAMKKAEVTLDKLLKRDFASLKKPITYMAIAGISYGLYLLTWPGGLLVGMILFVYCIAQIVLDHMKGKSTDYVMYLAAFGFIIPAIMVLPFSANNLGITLFGYSLAQPLFLTIAFLGVAAAYALSVVLNKNKVDKFVYPVTLLGAAVVGALVTMMALPQVWAQLMTAIQIFLPDLTVKTIREAIPTYNLYGSTYSLLNPLNIGELDFSPFWDMIYFIFPVSLAGLAILGYRLYKEKKSTHLLFFIWSLVMLFAYFQQNRFVYYYSINGSILVGLCAIAALNLVGLDKLKKAFAKKVKSMDDALKFFNKNMTKCVSVALVIVLFLIMALYPMIPLPYSVTWETAKGSPGIDNYQWYEALYWMKSHTPDPQGSTVSASFDYLNGSYSKPTSADGKYSYPDSAYGVMSWWDYGHLIEYIANRIPNANPFQAGITELNGTTGAAVYFTSTNEDKSVKMLDDLGSRYVIIDYDMAAGKFPAIQTWVDDTQGWYTAKNLSAGNGQNISLMVDSPKFESSIMNRLYYEDCDGMSHYRLIYEPASGVWTLDGKGINLDAGTYFSNGIQIADYNEAYNQSGRMAWANDAQTMLWYEFRPPVKFVKIFEKVDGATISGSATDGTQINLSLKLKCNSTGREFFYNATTVAKNGAYSFVVPYSTGLPNGDGYSYDVKAITKYVLTLGNDTKTVDVSENAVMNGGVVQVP